ncbi:deoxyhypusine synthase [Candidatus Woesearchaeota archaeon]|nr:deoxyhypusine synthase [Candidatus Woesearchaeota archaeon]
MKIKSIHGMGSHLTIDGFDADSKLLDDEKVIRQVLEELVPLLEMKKLSEPVVKRGSNQDPERGITGFVIIEESHISIHTYPEKGYVAADIFSCKEFDSEKALGHLRDRFNIKRLEKQLSARGHSHLFEADKHLEKVQGLKLEKGMKVSDLLKQYKNLGFQATHVGQAVDTIRQMRKDKAVVFFSFTSNMVSSGLRELFAEMVKKKLVDVIVTSIGSIEEDLIKTKKPFLLGSFNADDKDLHKKGINRIGNVYVPNDRYELLEDMLIPFFEKMYELQKKEGMMLSPRKTIHELGKTIEDENSIIYWAAKNNIPVFCPAPTDGAFGLQLYFFKQGNPDFGIDVTADMKELADLTLAADKTGGIILGGGFAKHHIIGVNILREGLDYAVYVTTATQYDGSLSGARSNEAISWSKLKEEANNVCIEADATVAFPLIAAAVMESLDEEGEDAER